MADINYEELERQLNQSRAEMDKFNSSLRQSTNADGILTNSNRIASAAIDTEIKARRELVQKLTDFADEITKTTVNTGKSLTNGQSNFGAIKGVVGISIKAIGGLTSSIGGLVPGIGAGLSKIADTATNASIQMAELIIDQFTVGWDSYRNLADTGTVKNFSDLSELAESTGLRFEQIDATLGKYSTVLATYNTGLNRGKDGFKKLAAESKPIRDDMYKIGINAQDFAELQAKYIGEQNSLGRTKDRTDKQLAQGTREYIQNLNTQAKLFGLSRKEQQQNRDIALSEDKFRASLNRIAEEAGDPERARKIQDSAINLSTILQKTAPTVAGGIRELFAGRGAATGELSRQLEVQTGGAAGKIALALRLGQIDEYEARNQIIDAIEKQQKKTQHIAQYTNDNAVARSYAENANLVAEGKRTKQQVADAKKTIEATDAETGKLANTAKGLEHASQQIQNLTTSSDIAAGAINTASDSIDSVATKLNQLLGNKPATRSMDIGAPPVPGPAVKVAGPPSFGGYPRPEEFMTFGSQSGSKINFDQLDTQFRARVIQASQEYYDISGGKKIKINSARRDSKKQKELYDAWVEGGKKGKPVGKPGMSRHERGIAVDIQNYRDPLAVQAFNKFGLFQDVVNDPVHFQTRSARTGGIFKNDHANKYQVELHGDEVVADVVGNKIQNPFTSREKIKILNRMKKMAGDRLDSMIDALSSTTGIQRKLVAAAI